MRSQPMGGTPQRIELTLQPSAIPGAPVWLEATTVLVWPVAVFLAVTILRKSIAEALKGLGARAKSLSFGIVAFDFGEATVRALAPESLDDVRDIAPHAPMLESGAALTVSLTDPTPAECIVVDLGAGEDWITSRLYVVASLVARMRGIRVMVFTASASAGSRLVGTAQPEHVRWALAAAYPWLEVAYLHAQHSLVSAVSSATVERGQVSLTRDGRLDSWDAVQTFNAYKHQLQTPVPPVGTSGWINLGEKWERANWVTPTLLTSVLAENLNRGAVRQDFDTPADELARRVLRFPLDYVPTIDGTGTFLRVVARRAYANRTLRQVADGQ